MSLTRSGRTTPVRGVFIALWCALAVLAIPTASVAGPGSPRLSASATRPVGDDPWLETINWWRGFGGGIDGSPFPLVTSSPADNTGSQNHVDYLTEIWEQGSTYCGHGADPNFPKAPDVDYFHNVLYCGPPTLTDAVDGWNNTPYHGGPLLRPSTLRVGAATASLGDRTANAARAFGTRQVDTIYTFPAPGGVLPRVRMRTGESPEPRDFCPPIDGGSPGQSVFAWFPEDRTLVDASLRDDDGEIPFCVLGSPFSTESQILDPGESAREFIFFSRRPYTIGSTVTASIVTKQSDGVETTVEWSFSALTTPAIWSEYSSIQGGAGRVVITTESPSFPETGGSPVLSTELVLMRRDAPFTETVIDVSVSFPGETVVPVPPDTYWACLRVNNILGASRCNYRQGIAVRPNTSPSKPTIVTVPVTTEATERSVVGYVASNDPDDRDELLTYRLSGPDARSFEVVDGALRVAAPLDERDYLMEIVAVDELGARSPQTDLILSVTKGLGSIDGAASAMQSAVRCQFGSC